VDAPPVPAHTSTPPEVLTFPSQLSAPRPRAKQTTEPALELGYHSPIPIRAPSPVAGTHQGPAPVPRDAQSDSLQTVGIKVTGFLSQPEMLRFATAMESEPDFAEVSLSRVAESDAWFAVRVTSAEHAAQTLGKIAGFDIHCVVERDSISVRVHRGRFPARVPPFTSVPPADAPSNTETSLSSPAPVVEPPSQEPLLPSRPRFRVFRPIGEPPT